MPRLGDTEADPDAVVQLGRWLREAQAAGWPWAHVMTLATATVGGRPSARAVVMRGFDHSGFVFDSDYQSRKGVELRDNPWGAVVFLWPQAQRQVRAEGRVEPMAAEESDRRFRAAPRDQRLAISALPQSRVVAGRDVLERRLGEVRAAFADRDVPRPEYWGGYRLEPSMVELWQGRPDRLHDRLRYRRQAGGWALERLSP